jgi:hypothetical protein
MIDIVQMYIFLHKKISDPSFDRHESVLFNTAERRYLPQGLAVRDSVEDFACSLSASGLNINKGSHERRGR